MLRVLLVLTYAVLCFKFGAWKKWKDYYPTYLYAIIGDITYNFLFYEKSLWEYRNLVSHTFSNFLVALFVFPCAITLYLTYYPNKRWKQLLYILLWTIANTLIEFAANQLGDIVFLNNWNIYWSMALYFIAFVLVRVHYVKPLLVWPTSFALAYITMYLFNVPLRGMK